MSDENLHTGAVNGGTSQLFQQLIFRPAPGFGRAETPLRNVFLGSAGASPAAGCTACAAATPHAQRSPPTVRVVGRGVG